MKPKIISLFILLMLNLPAFSQKDSIYGDFYGYLNFNSKALHLGPGYYDEYFDMDPSPYGKAYEKGNKNIVFMCERITTSWPVTELPFEDSLIYISNTKINKSDTILDIIYPDIIKITTYYYIYKGQKLFFDMETQNSISDKQDNKKFMKFMSFCITHFKEYIDNYSPSTE